MPSINLRLNRLWTLEKKHTTIVLNEHSRETTPLALLFPWTATPLSPQGGFLRWMAINTETYDWMKRR